MIDRLMMLWLRVLVVCTGTWCVWAATHSGFGTVCWALAAFLCWDQDHSYNPRKKGKR